MAKRRAYHAYVKAMDRQRREAEAASSSTGSGKQGFQEEGEER